MKRGRIQRPINLDKVNLNTLFSFHSSSQLSDLAYKNTCAHDSHPDPLRVVLELIHNLDLSWVVLEFNTHLHPLQVVLELIHDLDLLRVIIEFKTHLYPFAGHSRTLYTSRSTRGSF